jgi:hypothetical protein
MPAAKPASVIEEVDADLAAEEFANLDELLGKPAATEDFDIMLPTPDGPVKRKLRFQAIPSDDYDTLQSRFPPTAEQKKNGSSVNWDKFAPALVAACLVKPAMSYEQVQTMFSSAQWSSGELANLFSVANALCVSGFDVPKSESG